MSLTYTTPVDWPPRYGDEWTGRAGKKWTGEYRPGVPGVVLADESGWWAVPAAILDLSGPLELTHRREVTP